MKQSRSISLQFWLPLLFLLLFFSLMGIYSFSSLLQQKDTLIENQRRDISYFLTSLSRELNIAFRNQTPHLAKQAITASAVYPHVEAVFVIDREGKVVLSSDQGVQGGVCKRSLRLYQ